MSRRYWNAVSSKSKRDYRRFHMNFKHMRDMLIEEMLDDVDDAVSGLLATYEFKNALEFKNVVMQQVDMIMKHDIAHRSLYDWRMYGSIDFFADPFFRGHNIQLSKLLTEIDTYHTNGTQPSRDCLEYFNVREFNPEASYAMNKIEPGECE